MGFHMRAIREAAADMLAGNDTSHDMAHAERVASTVLALAQESGVESEEDVSVCVAAAILHDTVDHKYCTAEEQAVRWSRIEGVLEEHGWSSVQQAVIRGIMDNMSYSKQRDGKAEDLGPHQWMCDLVSDADKLDALGEVGLQRCAAYSLHLNPTLSPSAVDDRVRQHCHDKLLRLPAYIRTAAARARLAPLLDPIHAFIGR